ncbi:hypothetical protein RI367_008690, partial [Sorochytrium milnesiophthora]
MLEHSFRKIANFDPGVTMFYNVGTLSVRVFFVLSAFLITYRLLLEWHEATLLSRRPSSHSATLDPEAPEGLLGQAGSKVRLPSTFFARLDCMRGERFNIL